MNREDCFALDEILECAGINFKSDLQNCFSMYREEITGDAKKGNLISSATTDDTLKSVLPWPGSTTKLNRELHTNSWAHMKIP